MPISANILHAWRAHQQGKIQDSFLSLIYPASWCEDDSNYKTITSSLCRFTIKLFRYWFGGLFMWVYAGLHGLAEDRRS